MAFNFPKIKFPFFTRYLDGTTFYQIDQFNNWGGLGKSNLEVAQNHPILTPAILFLAKLFSQAEFYIENRTTKEKITNHWLLKLLEKPNYYQTGEDLLETTNFTQIAVGKAVLYIKKPVGTSKPPVIYSLNPELIEYPDEFKTKLSRLNLDNKIGEVKILYDREGENQKIKFKDLLFFYDLPNCLDTTNCFETKSRIDGLKQTLINTNDSLLAKNIILKTNGKELITGDKSGEFPLTAEEKKDIENLFQNNYGLGTKRKRGIVTKSSLTYKSMHIALRDLGLDESVKVDGNLIYTALHLPKDIISLEAKKTTYNNFKESMVSFIQNEMQPSINAFTAPFQRLLNDDNLRLVGTYEHMPIMKFILIEKYKGIQLKGQALAALRAAGLPDDIALEELGYDKNITLNELKPQNEDNSSTGTQSEGSQSEGNSDE